MTYIGLVPSLTGLGLLSSSNQDLRLGYCIPPLRGYPRVNNKDGGAAELGGPTFAGELFFDGPV